MQINLNLQEHALEQVKYMRRAALIKAVHV